MNQFAMWAILTPIGQIMAMFQLQYEAAEYVFNRQDKKYTFRRVNNDQILAGKDAIYFLPLLCRTCPPGVLAKLPHDSLAKLQQEVLEWGYAIHLEQSAHEVDEHNDLESQNRSCLERIGEALNVSVDQDYGLLAPVPDEAFFLREER